MTGNFIVGKTCNSIDSKTSNSFAVKIGIFVTGNTALPFTQFIVFITGYLPNSGKAPKTLFAIYFLINSHRNSLQILNIIQQRSDYKHINIDD